MKLNVQYEDGHKKAKVKKGYTLFSRLYVLHCIINDISHGVKFCPAFGTH